MRTRTVLGCMTGTSLDAIDAACVKIRGSGLEMRVSVQGCATRALGEIGAPLRDLAEQQPMSAEAIAKLSHSFSQAQLDVIRQVAPYTPPDLIAVHGQTVFHDPPHSWQLLTPAPIARAMATPVVFDMRAADLADGGRGAPITPLADYVLFRAAAPVVVLNLGGFCNFTRLPAVNGDGDAPLEQIAGGDVCACNHLLDEIARTCFGSAFDASGARAARGRIRDDLGHELRTLLSAQCTARRSLGTGDELATWVAASAARVSGEDLARTACAAIAATIAEALRASGDSETRQIPSTWLAAGGGALNGTLMSELAARVQRPVGRTDAHGVPATHREAVAMAVLGALCQDGVPITLPQVTGVAAPAPIAGAWVTAGSRLTLRGVGGQ